MAVDESKGLSFKRNPRQALPQYRLDESKKKAIVHIGKHTTPAEDKRLIDDLEEQGLEIEISFSHKELLVEKKEAEWIDVTNRVKKWRTKSARGHILDRLYKLISVNGKRQYKCIESNE